MKPLTKAEIDAVDPRVKRHFMNVGGQLERNFIRKRVRRSVDLLDTLLTDLDEHVKLAGKRKGGLGPR